MIRNVICLVSRSEGNSLTDRNVIESQIPFYIMFTLPHNEIQLGCTDLTVEHYGINLILSKRFDITTLSDGMFFFSLQTDTPSHSNNVPKSNTTNDVAENDVVVPNIEDMDPLDYSPERLGRMQFSVKYDFQEMTLTLRVMRAVELPAKDFSGTSDPYVKIMLLPDKKHKLQTNIKRRNLNPRWNEVFAFEGWVLCCNVINNIRNMYPHLSLLIPFD